MHQEGVLVILFVITAILSGSILKALLKDSRLPYTVVLLLVGIIIASLDRFGWLGDSSATLIFEDISAIDPKLILFLFLPTLIFESAFSMEPHLFFRIAPQTIILAIAGLVISMLLTAIATHWLFTWSFGVALLFGALISATDPVAVVSLLKEKSSRKRLETLVDGESLLNDGTAIVFFSLFYGFALGTVTEIHPVVVIWNFIWVVSVGMFAGFAVGWLTLQIIGRLFNQPLVEIALSIGAAYMTFFIAESLEVSGVVALVTLALTFSTIGRTRISPEISHFLHQFWEMIAYIANTLIFLMVGIIIVLHVRLDSVELWFNLFILYILLMMIRAIAIWMLAPILSRISIGFNKEKGLVLIWGGLRGAISLSLALSLSRDEAVPEVLREQILFLTAGIVVLTIIINGSTIEWLLHKLKFDRLPPAKEASAQKARDSLTQELNTFVKSLYSSPFFNDVNNKELDHFINTPDASVIASDTNLKEDEIDVSFRRRLLEIERSDYWRQFEEGYIGRQAAYHLSQAVEHALDNKPEIAPRRDLADILTIPVPPEWIRKMPMIGDSLEYWIFTRLSLAYDIARGLVEAQEEMRRHIAILSPSDQMAKQVEQELDLNCSQAFTFTRLVDKHYPHLVSALQTRSAKRLLLNHERSLIWKMEHDGVLEESEALHLIDQIEAQMVRLRKDEKESSDGNGQSS